MVSFVGSLRARPDRTPVYTQDEAVSPLIAMEKILDCQMRPMASNRPVPKQVFVNQYLVKWKGFSYLHSSWVPEHEFEKAYKSISGLETRVNQFHSTMESLGNNVYDHVAIPPEWTSVDRIISYREEDGQREYLVKFKGLSYGECYWESESDISTFQKEIRRFFDINFGHHRGTYADHERNPEGFKQIGLTPEFITGSLHPYHLERLNFLRSAWSTRTHVVLVDEMGLGITIPSIAFLASLVEENVAPFLLIAPPSTLRNWEREFTTWAPHMNVVVYDGTSQARNVIIKHEFYLPRGHINGVHGGTKQNRIKFDVILTSYEIIGVDTAVLKPIKWKCMIVDEGYRLKNENPKLFYSLKQYSCEHHVLLTGRLPQVANSEYIDDNVADTLEAQAGDSDEHRSEQLGALGKRKRNHKQIVEKEAEPTEGEAARQGNKKTKRLYRRRTHRNRRPRPLIEGQGKSLRVLGFRKSQRRTFLDTLMRYGVGNYDWKKFVHPLKRKTYDEIKNYGIFFLKHMVKETEDTNPPTFSDMIPKEGLSRDQVLARITVMILLQEKVELIETHPRKAVFPDYIIERYIALRKEQIWNKEHDKSLLRAVSKHGFGKWIDIVKDQEFELEQVICKVLKVPVENLIRTGPEQKDPKRQLADFLRKRFEILENAMSDECAARYYNFGRRTERPLQDIAIADIKLSLSAI